MKELLFTSLILVFIGLGLFIYLIFKTIIKPKLNEPENKNYTPGFSKSYGVKKIYHLEREYNCPNSTLPFTELCSYIETSCNETLSKSLNF